jgi:hypothetical protein
MRTAVALLACLCMLLAAALAWVTQRDAVLRLAGLAPPPPPPAAEALPPPDAPDALDPTPYRDAIEALEAILYRDGPPAWADPDAVSSIAMRLGDRLYADLGPLRGQQAMSDLVDWAGAVGAQAESGYATPELDAPRASWEVLRAKWFRRAPWFTRTTARLVAAQRPAAPTASLVDLVALWSWAAAIEAAAGDGRAALDRFGDPPADAPAASDDDRAQLAQFEAFARDWDARVGALDAQAPRRPGPGGEPNLAFAYEALEQATEQLARATVPDGDATLPPRSWRTQCLDGAAAHLEAARRFLARAHTGVTLAPTRTASLPAAPAP